MVYLALLCARARYGITGHWYAKTFDAKQILYLYRNKQILRTPESKGNKMPEG